MVQSTPPQPPREENPRPIGVGRVFIGIGVTVAAYAIFGCGLPILLNQFESPALAAIGFGVPVLLFLAALAFGIIQVVRGDRGIGVGVLIAGALIPIILAGVCIALIAALSGTRTFG
jgi:hypothetical protein